MFELVTLTTVSLSPMLVAAALHSASVRITDAPEFLQLPDRIIK